MRVHATPIKTALCWICGLPFVGKSDNPAALRRSKDHIIPRCKGGQSIFGNLEWAHLCCNSWRGHEDVTERMRAEFKQEVMKAFPRVMKRALVGTGLRK